MTRGKSGDVKLEKSNGSGDLCGEQSRLGRGGHVDASIAKPVGDRQIHVFIKMKTHYQASGRLNRKAARDPTAFGAG